MRQSASRNKNSERTEQIGPGNVGVNFEEEDLVTNIDEESEDEGKKTMVAVYIKDTFSKLNCCLLTHKLVIILFNYL